MLEHATAELLTNAIVEAMPKNTQRNYHEATVLRTDEDGVVWVSISGGAPETPVSYVANECDVGDTVSVVIENGKARIVSNQSNPSAGVKIVREVYEVSLSAEEQSTRASEAALLAEESARLAGSAADAALRSAETANTAAKGALLSLSEAQDVIGVVNWITEHGEYNLTRDTVPDPDKVYYTRTGSGTVQDPYIYTPVSAPEEASMSSYYELSIDQALSQFVASHLALTDEGLFVLKDESSWKTLMKTDGWEIRDPYNDPAMSIGANGVDFAASKSWHIGSNDAYILYTPANGQNPPTLVIGGSNVRLGENRTLSDLLAEVDNDLDFKVEDSYSQDGLEVTLTAHVYKGGVDVAPLHPELYPDSCFAWYRKNENGYPQNPIGNGRTITLQRSVAGYGAAIKCVYTPVNDAGLLTESDDQLTTQDDEPLTARTPSGDYVRVADLTVETVVFDTDKVMLVGSEDEHLVSIATLKETFGDGDYERLSNKPSIEGVTLSGDKTFPEFGIFQRDQSGYDVPDDYTLSTMDINALWANSVAIGA